MLVINKMKTLLVTGGSGLIGNAIHNLINDYPSYSFIFVSSKQYDLRIMDETRNMFETYKPDLVIHLASNVGGLYKNMNNKVEMLEDNLLINYNIVKCSYKYKVQKLIACLSTCIYRFDVIAYPIKENQLHDGPPHNSNDSYAYAKRMLDIHCKSYRDNYGSNFMCIIPTNVYGPYDNFNLENGHVLPSLINKCFLARKNDSSFEIKGTGAPLRQFIFSYDIAKLIMVVLDNDIKDNIILSVPEKDEISIGDVGKIIAKCFDYDNRIIFDSTSSDGQYKKTVSNDKIQQYVKDFEFTKIEDGIKQTIDWFLLNEDKRRI